ncbi:hypothetical protein HNQ96_004984 [Aminobacter lissarensis]|uniref:Uncharacterized protein n=2 Tax=Aminobacter carboxidus TaxID=376165 RepID=A0A8E1WHL5_9HYPH|nr:hypothetical protein [Aminobacter lissarensis]
MGGTTAWSGGWLWIPGNQQRALLECATIQLLRGYLRNELGNRYGAKHIDAFSQYRSLNAETTYSVLFLIGSRKAWRRRRDPRWPTLRQ